MSLLPKKNERSRRGFKPRLLRFFQGLDNKKLDKMRRFL